MPKKMRQFDGNRCRGRAISITDGDWDAIRSKAKAEGSDNVSAYIRDCCLFKDAPFPVELRPAMLNMAKDLGVTPAVVSDRILTAWWARALSWEAVNGPVEVGSLPEFSVGPDVPTAELLSALIRAFSAELREAKLQENEALAAAL